MILYMNNFDVNHVHSEGFLIDFKNELETLLKKYPTPADFVRDELGVENIMDVEFTSLGNIKDEDIVFDMSRGNPALSKKSVITPIESKQIILEAINISFK